MADFFEEIYSEQSKFSGRIDSLSLARLTGLIRNKIYYELEISNITGQVRRQFARFILPPTALGLIDTNKIEELTNSYFAVVGRIDGMPNDLVIFGIVPFTDSEFSQSLDSGNKSTFGNTTSNVILDEKEGSTMKHKKSSVDLKETTASINTEKTKVVAEKERVYMGKIDAKEHPVALADVSENKFEEMKSLLNDSINVSNILVQALTAAVSGASPTAPGISAATPIITQATGELSTLVAKVSQLNFADINSKDVFVS